MMGMGAVLSLELVALRTSEKFQRSMLNQSSKTIELWIVARRLTQEQKLKVVAGEVYIEGSQDQ